MANHSLQVDRHRSVGSATLESDGQPEPRNWPGSQNGCRNPKDLSASVRHLIRNRQAQKDRRQRGYQRDARNATRNPEWTDDSRFADSKDKQREELEE